MVDCVRHEQQLHSVWCVWFSGWRKFSHKDSPGAAKSCQLARFQWETGSQTLTYRANIIHCPLIMYHLDAGQWPGKAPRWDNGLRFLKQPPMAKILLIGQWLLTGAIGPRLFMYGGSGVHMCMWLKRKCMLCVYTWFVVHNYFVSMVFEYNGQHYVKWVYST